MLLEMMASHQLRCGAHQYTNYDIPPYQVSFGQRQSRSSTDLFQDSLTSSSSFDHFRPHQRQLGWSGRQLAFDETIEKLIEAMGLTEAYIKPLQRDFSNEISGIRSYASQSIIDKLWEMRFEIKQRPIRQGYRKAKARLTEHHDHEVQESDTGEWIKQIKALRYAWYKLERALQAAAHGATPTISTERRGLKEFEDKALIARTVSKMQTSGRQCLDLLAKSRRKFSQLRPLLGELEFLGQIIEPWKDLKDLMRRSDEMEWGEELMYDGAYE